MILLSDGFAGHGDYWCSAGKEIFFSLFFWESALSVLLEHDKGRHHGNGPDDVG
jgi:hypothetical protein